MLSSLKSSLHTALHDGIRNFGMRSQDDLLRGLEELRREVASLRSELHNLSQEIMRVFEPAIRQHLVDLSAQTSK